MKLQTTSFNPRRKTQRAGFTLIEVMLALAILGSAMFVLLDGHFAALRLFQEIHDQSVRRNLIEQALAMAEVELMAGNLNGSGDFGKRYPEYKYSFVAEQIGDEALALFQIVVKVEGPAMTEEMTILAYDPR